VRLNFIYFGTLVVDIADLKKNAVAWRATAKGKINPKAGRDRRNQNIQKAVEKIFRDYSPKKKR
jgi:hypothetical protein